jgi:acyl-[acyl-carrier-protein]-phospholipid O-acyltransferase/long-chain-fatty-acid--[acyl-carrier-protein] ligase
MRALVRFILRLLYGYKIFNEEALTAPGPVLLLSNHVSWWDWLLLGVCLDSDWRFVTSLEGANVSWLHRKIMVNRRTFPVDMNSPYAVKRMAEYLQTGGRLALFPEGRLSRTGSLMKLYEGTGFLLHKTRPKVITAFIRNACRLPLSPNPNCKQWFPRISLHFSAVQTAPATAAISSNEARKRLTNWLRDRMIEQQFEAAMTLGPQTLPAAIFEAGHMHRKKVAIQDVTMQEITYRQLAIGSRALARRWSTLPRDERRIGVLLPNSNAIAITLTSLWVAGKVPAILNFSFGVAGMLSSAKLANLKTIVTARLFVERLKLDINLLKASGINILFIEDIRNGISRWQKFTAALADLSPLAPMSDGHDTAVILFTSGSEAEPKGVELTHQNLLANVRQITSRIDVLETDRVCNAMPMFHSFGLTGGLLLPLVHGCYTLLYVSPLHYRVIPSAFYNLDCTILFGTNTFLAGYGRKAHPYDFRSLRYVVSGAEKLLASTIDLWNQKFGARILEGYGATECSPCVTLNVPMRPKSGSAGEFLPAIEHRLEPVEGVTEGGRLFVRGPNVMRGYVNPTGNAEFQKLKGWYDTGDVVNVDSDGFVFVLGRMKRFAKISGEMVSLTAVEDALASAFHKYGPRFSVALVARADSARGEKLIAVTNESKLTLDEMRDTLRASGMSNLAIPREIRVLKELPRLGTGKINHRQLETAI